MSNWTSDGRPRCNDCNMPMYNAQGAIWQCLSDGCKLYGIRFTRVRRKSTKVSWGTPRRASDAKD